MNRLQLALIVCMTALATSAEAAPKDWAEYSGFHPGMSKTAAKAVGLMDCEEHALDSVTCTPVTSLSVDGVVPSKAEITFDSKLNVIQSVEITFPKESYEKLVRYYTNKYGNPTFNDEHYVAREWVRRSGYGTCPGATVWHRGGDGLFGICSNQWRRSGSTHVKADIEKGRGKEILRILKLRRDREDNISSFNTK